MDTYKATMFPIYLAFLIFFWIGLSDFIQISFNKDPEALLKVKKRKIPRIPLACIACMYLYLLNAALRLFRFQDSLRYGIQMFDFICMFMVICILSVFNLITVRTLRRTGITQQIRNSWITLKLAFIPFLPLNLWLFDKTTDYIKPEIIGYAVALIIFFPILLFLMFLIAIFFPVVIYVANGCIGISYILHLIKQTEKSQRPSVVHFVMQMVPGLDLISMLFILIKYREPSVDAKITETDSATVYSPCSVSSPCASKPAPVAEPKMYKKVKKQRRFLFLLYLLCGILLYFSSEIAESTAEVHEEVTTEETAFYEMTDEEIALIQDHYFDNEAKEKIAAGQLTGFQAELLENLRNGYSYIESKYPGRQFQIKEMYHRYNDSYYMRNTLNTVLPEVSYYSLRIVPVQPSDRVYQMEFSTSPDSVVEDNLYAYLQEESYFRYIEDRLASEIPGFAKIDTDNWYYWYLAEYEDPADLTVDAVLNGEYLAGLKFVDVYIAAGGRTADECNQQEKTLRKIFRHIELPVQRYTVHYYDLTIEEILADDFNPDDTIAAFAIHQDLPEDSP